MKRSENTEGIYLKVPPDVKADLAERQKHHGFVFSEWVVKTYRQLVMIDDLEALKKQYDKNMQLNKAIKEKIEIMEKEEEERIKFALTEKERYALYDCMKICPNNVEKQMKLFQQSVPRIITLEEYIKVKNKYSEGWS